MKIFPISDELKDKILFSTVAKGLTAFKKYYIIALEPGYTGRIELFFNQEGLKQALETKQVK